MGGDRLTVRIVNDLAEIARLAGIVETYCADRGIPESCAFKVNLALEELLANTIAYGYADAKRHEIELEIVRENGDLVIEMTDDALAFDPLQAPPPDLDAPLEERPIGGLGIHFARTALDAIAYRRDNGRNRLTLRKHIGSAPG